MSSLLRFFPSDKWRRGWWRFSCVSVLYYSELLSTTTTIMRSYLLIIIIPTIAIMPSSTRIENIATTVSTSCIVLKYFCCKMRCDVMCGYDGWWDRKQMTEYRVQFCQRTLQILIFIRVFMAIRQYLGQDYSSSEARPVGLGVNDIQYSISWG